MDAEIGQCIVLAVLPAMQPIRKVTIHAGFDCISMNIGIDRFHSRDRWPQWAGETIRNI